MGLIIKMDILQYKPFIKKGNVEAKIMFGHRL